MTCEPPKLILIYIVSHFFFQINDLSPLVSDFTNNTVSYASKTKSRYFSLDKGKMFSILYEQSTNYSVIRKYQISSFEFQYPAHM